jgi:hypothetical protein
MGARREAPRLGIEAAWAPAKAPMPEGWEGDGADRGSVSGWQMEGGRGDYSRGWVDDASPAGFGEVRIGMVRFASRAGARYTIAADEAYSRQAR